MIQVALTMQERTILFHLLRRRAAELRDSGDPREPEDWECADQYQALAERLMPGRP